MYNLHFLTSGNPGRAHLFVLLLTCVEGFSKGDTTFYLTSPAVCLHGGPKQRSKQQMQPQALRSAGLAEIERPELDLYDLAEPTNSLWLDLWLLSPYSQWSTSLDQSRIWWLIPPKAPALPSLVPRAFFLCQTSVGVGRAAALYLYSARLSPRNSLQPPAPCNC